MTIDQLKSEHPEVFAAVYNNGVKAERERASVWAHYADVDANAVKEGIKGGEPMGEVARIEFMEKRFAQAKIEAVKKENNDTTTTGEAKDKGTEQSAVEKFEAELAEVRKNKTA